MNDTKSLFKQGLYVCGIGAPLSAIFSVYSFFNFGPELICLSIISTGLHSLGVYLNYKELKKQKESDLEKKL